MKTHFVIALLVALLLSAVGIYIYKHPDSIRDKYYSWSEKCSFSESICVALLSPLKILSDTAFEIKRKSVPIEELPILRIYMSDGALKKIQEKRSATLKEHNPILLADDDDWVKATMLANDGRNTRKGKVRLRLKGDWVDHFRNNRKLSFRIKVRNNNKIFGMSKFSIQAPRTRNYQFEPMLLDLMRQVDVLAPRYFFVDVRLNDMKVGIMALEEHFTKQLVESQQRREGPIVALDEDPIWQQRHLNYNRSKFNSNGTHYVPRDLSVKVFRGGKFKPGTIKTQHNIRAISLLRDFMDGTVDANAVFDLDKVSRWWIVTNIWKGSHGTTEHNLRFYFNPITGLLEPVAFDNDPHPRMDLDLQWINSVVTRHLLDDPGFVDITRKNLGIIANVMLSEDFGREFDAQQKKYLDILDIDGGDFNEISLSELKLNLASFIRVLKEKVPVPHATASKIVKHRQRRAIDDPVHNADLLKSDTPLYTHLRSSVFWYSDHVELELKNLTVRPVTVEAIYFKDRPEENFWNHKVTIPSYVRGSSAHIITKKLDVAGSRLNDVLLVKYGYQSKQYIRSVTLQFRDHQTGYSGPDVAEKWFDEQRVLINRRRETVIFPPGRYRLEQNIETRPNWLVVLMPGVELDLEKGAVFKINGPLYSLGREDKPVNIRIQSSADKGLLGSWGGLLVQKAGHESVLLHTVVSGHGYSNPATRQDSLGLTGCITFYESEVTIQRSTFSDMQCEDALNVVRSRFRFDNLSITRVHADALDTDFAEGSITDSKFSHSGNDGVDISGSKVTIVNTRFSDINDKAISVGEASFLKADKLDIRRAKSGVVSKDESNAEVSNTFLGDIEGSALFAYVKKQEYGPAQLHCKNCNFKNVESQATEQFGSRITLNGTEVDTTYFSRKQLRAADYIR